MGKHDGSFDLFLMKMSFDHDMQLTVTEDKTKGVKVKPQKFKLIAKSSHLTIWIYMTKKTIR